MWGFLAVSVALAGEVEIPRWGAKPPDCPAPLEVGVDIAAVVNDPFLRTGHLGARVGWRVDRVLAFEARAAAAPNFGQADWTPITKQLALENRVSPDISRPTTLLGGAVVFAPVSGEVRSAGRDPAPFDVLVALGVGAVRTHDEFPEEWLEAARAARQWHPTLTWGLAAQVAASDLVTLRVDARSELYVEVIESTTLEWKQPMSLSAGVSFHPGRGRAARADASPETTKPEEDPRAREGGRGIGT